MPYWLLIPQWLPARSGMTTQANRRFLLDVLTGQLCAFLAVKIHDDVFDRQTKDLALIYAADQLLLSAAAAFEPYFSSRSTFWSFMRDSLKKTFNAISDVDHAQVHGYGAARSAARSTAGMYAVCNLATYAVCLRAGRRRMYPRIQQCTDEIACVGQYLDDLEDIKVDLRRGRLNYAGSVLGGKRAHGKSNVLRMVARGALVEGRSDTFLSMLHGHIVRAARYAGLSGIPELIDLVKTHSDLLDSIEYSLHSRRVKFVLGSIAPARR